MLDFIVIGAQKSGTTTLYEHLSSHPGIFIPKGKEAPYFNRGEIEGYPEYIKKFFPAERESKIFGKVSPQYMSNDEISEKVCTANPRAKYIAILRDPVQRAISHFNMNVNRGFENRNIDDVLNIQLEPCNLLKARALPGLMRNEKDCYVAWGEYNRILKKYVERAGEENLLVIYLEDFTNFPVDNMNKVYSFLGVDNFKINSGLNDVYFKSGETKVFHDSIDILKKIGMRPVWRLIPEAVRARLYFGMEQLVAKSRPANKMLPAKDTIDNLNSFYSNGDALGDVVSGYKGWFT